MSSDTPLMLVAPGQGDADWLYACGFDVENALFFDFGANDRLLVVSELEFERAMVEARNVKVVDRREVGWVESRDGMAAWSAVAAHVLRQRGVNAVRVSPHLPVAYYEALQKADVAMEIDRELFRERRRRKSREEASFIHAAQHAAESACAEVIAHLAVSEIKDGLLWLDGRPLTSQRLMARAEAALAEIGYTGSQLIIAGSPENALPHFRGEGQLRAHAPIIIDIFPRGMTSGYRGDLTRTVVVGEVSDQVRAMWEASLAAMESALALIKAGVNGRDVHLAACKVLVERGYGTYTKGFEGNLEGPRMTHSLGHGVGLDVHEAPSLRDLDYPLVAGDVVTVEPGLYLAGLGGVRVEDTGIVTADGFHNFTTLPKNLDPKAFL
jgi:Xaa-Pro aminopeptidase